MYGHVRAVRARRETCHSVTGCALGYVCPSVLWGPSIPHRCSVGSPHRGGGGVVFCREYMQSWYLLILSGIVPVSTYGRSYSIQGTVSDPIRFRYTVYV